MWSPTHVQVLVRRAKGLNIKGKNGKIKTDDNDMTMNFFYLTVLVCYRNK